MAHKQKISWQDYITSFQNKKIDPNLLNIKGIDQILNFNQNFQSFFSHSIPLIYLLDYTTGKYMMVSHSSKAIIGHNSEYLKNAGVYFAFENYQKDFFKVYSEETFADRISFIRKVEPENFSNYIFTHNFKLKARDGKYKNLLQRSCFIKSDDKGNPLLSLGMVININHFHRENILTEVIEKMTDFNLPNTIEVVNKKLYFLHQEDKLLTKREKEILACIADGLNSKEIASKLYLSEYTVINHRRHIHEKTNTNNVAELINFSVKQGFI